MHIHYDFVSQITHELQFKNVKTFKNSSLKIRHSDYNFGCGE